jgi:hypothetical protein
MVVMVMMTSFSGLSELYGIRPGVSRISKQLGYHSVKFTMDIYYHWVPGGSKSEVDGLDDLNSDTIKSNPSATNKKRD